MLLACLLELGLIMGLDLIYGFCGLWIMNVEKVGEDGLEFC